jgi:hypothetical protein
VKARSSASLKGCAKVSDGRRRALRRLVGVGFERGTDTTWLEHRPARAGHLGTGTLACPHCDAPVALAGPVLPVEPLTCPYCRHHAPVRDFLSLAAPTRPARVEVRVVARLRPVVTRRA